MSEPPPAGLPFVTNVRVRYAETDAEGVVYYASYLAYFEVARVELLRALGCPVTEVRRRGVLLPAVSAECRYHRPARVDDLLEVRMWLLPARRATIGFAYQVWRGDHMLVSGRTQHAAVDAASGAAMRRPAWLEELLARAGAVIGAAPEGGRGRRGAAGAG
jgi:acyl-CoA thioester hydrolase